MIADAPASSAARLSATGTSVPVCPVPAITGTRPAACSTAIRTPRLRSASVIA
jgi:hypothetical protein